MLDGMQERRVAERPSMRQREPQSTLERFKPHGKAVPPRTRRKPPLNAYRRRETAGTATQTRTWCATKNVRAMIYSNRIRA